MTIIFNGFDWQEQLLTLDFRMLCLGIVLGCPIGLLMSTAWELWRARKRPGTKLPYKIEQGL